MTTTHQPTPTQTENPYEKRQRIRNIAIALGVFLTVVISLAPILWQVLTSIKVNADISAVPNVYIPSRYTLEHYILLFERRPFLRYIFNSAFVAIVSTVLALGLGAPAAYALARMRIPGERIILGIILIVVLFPYILLFLGLLQVVQALGIGNNYLVLIVPYTAINLPLTILTLRSFFLQLPKDLEDAAKVDGYSTLGMLLKIVLPMTLPALVTTGILAFIFAWNEYIFALTFVTRESLKTIPVAAAQLSGATLFSIPYGPLAAATSLGTFPLIILVLIFQRKIVQGLTSGAVKG
ncbi:carbohydrate ABC transporter permease [Geitlerinema sp. PCC 7407]|uniref:carbohydrate ABC transporter permease n=1 Tax=Geitlerinema sp. PCC 7407 TaxID=1173025 RepID=UPI00029FF46B|nr:carbohydrate ABC transporter permease [Geitlerinema sp. PCC 7407]AFY66696.1 carbohydrate ABC transporter membrane protein 2, CUT1 family [Geitlerinema sp. PCC 7407]